MGRPTTTRTGPPADSLPGPARADMLPDVDARADYDDRPGAPRMPRWLELTVACTVAVVVQGILFLMMLAVLRGP